jgi:bifunctional polynucleotide phosphatase/kinase
MHFKWIKNDNFIFGYSDEIISYEKIYLFDLDYTLIKTKSGKIFPRYRDDWMLLDNVKTKLMNLIQNNIIGIITNQKGLRNDNQINDWLIKIENIYKEVKFHFIFASLKDDEYRKPRIKSWEYIKQKINFDDVPVIYIGDACGRKNDHSDIDIKYALNLNFKFKTPEIFFKLSYDKEDLCTITYPNIIYYTQQKQQLLLNKIYKLINDNLNSRILIMMIGFPCSGKSFLRKILIDKFQNFKFYNKDSIVSKSTDKYLCDKPEKCDLIIDDNTNLDKNKRNTYLKKFNDYVKICILFDYDIEINYHLNYMRMYNFNEKLIPKVAFNKLNKNYDRKYNYDDDFDHVIKITKLFYEFNIELKYFY